MTIYLRLWRVPQSIYLLPAWIGFIICVKYCHQAMNKKVFHSLWAKRTTDNLENNRTSIINFLFCSNIAWLLTSKIYRPCGITTRVLPFLNNQCINCVNNSVQIFYTINLGIKIENWNLGNLKWNSMYSWAESCICQQFLLKMDSTVK